MRTFLTIVLATTLIVGCQNTDKKSNSGSSEKRVSLTAAGATFPLPYYNMVFSKAIQIPQVFW